MCHHVVLQLQALDFLITKVEFQPTEENSSSDRAVKSATPSNKHFEIIIT